MVAKKNNRIVCSFCLYSFNVKEIFEVRISPSLGFSYRTSCCSACSEKKETLLGIKEFTDFPSGMKEEEKERYKSLLDEAKKTR